MRDPIGKEPGTYQPDERQYELPFSETPIRHLYDRPSEVVVPDGWHELPTHYPQPPINFPDVQINADGVLVPNIVKHCLVYCGDTCDCGLRLLELPIAISTSH